MSMRRIKFKELNPAVSLFLSDALRPGEGIVVEDDAGRAFCGIVPYVEATAEEREAAWKRLERLQEKVSQSMQEQGVTEADVDRILSEDD